jgi:predicted O-methyltransferase YrrM
MHSFIHFIGIVAGFDHPASQVTDRELQLLLKYSRDARVTVELGCYEGKTSTALAANNLGRVFSIDPFFRGRLGICYGEQIARIYCKRLRLKNLKFVKGCSYEVAAGFREPIDFLFVDANHDYDAIKRDWEDWAPKVRNGGVIALHDCRQAMNSPDYLGTMRFYDCDIGRIDYVTEVESIDSLVLFRVHS